MPELSERMVIRDSRDAVQLLTLNHPKKRNALRPNLISEMSNRLSEIEADPGAMVVILTGAGSGFCSGLDLFHLARLDTEGRIGYLRGFFALFSQIYFLKQPVIAAVNGPAIAGGFDLAAACDLRLCSRDAQFGQTEVLLGITQMMYPVYKMIGFSRAIELAFTGELICADEAYRIDLVNRVHPAEELLSEAVKLAELLASRRKDPLFATKQLSRALIEANTKSAIKMMLDRISERLGSEEHKRELEHYVEQRLKKNGTPKLPRK